VVLPDGDWLYGAYYDTTGSAAPSGPTVGDGNPANLPPAQRDVQFMIYRPSCRLQTQTSVVPADGGGKRDIEITRCISELPPAAARPENGPSRQSAGADAPDRRLQTSAAGSTSADETDEGSRVTKRICQVDAQHVRSEDGGERTITIRRC
jgi:hypothetical protein